MRIVLDSDLATLPIPTDGEACLDGIDRFGTKGIHNLGRRSLRILVRNDINCHHVRAINVVTLEVMQRC